MIRSIMMVFRGTARVDRMESGKSREIGSVRWREGKEEKSPVRASNMANRGCLLDYELSSAVIVCMLQRPNEKRAVHHMLKSTQRENLEGVLVNMKREGMVLVGEARREV